MPNSIFKFKQFSIEQNNQVFKVGTDAVLLGCLTDILQANTILDIGTGTGVISLISAQRNTHANLYAIDSEKEAFTLASKNADNSIFKDRIQIIHTELQAYNPKIKFDYISCNPPYFNEKGAIHSEHSIARQQIKLNYNFLLEKSSTILSEKGILGVIFPFEDENNFVEIAKDYHLFPQKIVRIAGIKGGKIKRSVVELGFSQMAPLIEELYVEESPRVRSKEYAELTQDFYL